MWGVRRDSREITFSRANMDSIMRPRLSHAFTSTIADSNCTVENDSRQSWMAVNNCAHVPQSNGSEANPIALHRCASRQFQNHIVESVTGGWQPA